MEVPSELQPELKDDYLPQEPGVLETAEKQYHPVRMK